MNQSTATNTYLVISRGKWDEDAKKEDVQQAIDRFYEWYERNLESGRMLRGSRLQADGKVVEPVIQLGCLQHPRSSRNALRSAPPRGLENAFASHYPTVIGCPK